MLRNLCVSILTLFSTSLSIADTEFEGSVPLDLVKALLGNIPYGEPTIYSDLSAAFPEIDFPDELEIMGSIERGYGGITAVYSTALSDSQAQTALNEVYAEAGYIDFELPESRQPQGGFVSSSMNYPPRYNRFCHDSQGSITHFYNQMDQRGIVTISANPPHDNRSCADQIAEQQQAMGRMSGRQAGLHQYLPRMELPETEPRRFAPFAGIGGYSGSSSGIETGASLQTDWKIEEVFEHFSTQIVEQSWIGDSQNIGTSSAIGSWTLSPEPGTDLIGTLTVLKMSEESFQLKFQLTSTGASNNSGFSFLRAN